MEKMNEQRLSEGIKWKRDLEHLARQMTKKVATILTTNAKWFDEKAKRYTDKNINKNLNQFLVFVFHCWLFHV